MNLTELVAAVVTETKRPDKRDKILLAIQEATLFAHQFEFFKRDLVEIPIIFPEPLFKGSILYGSLLKGFRKIDYWRKFEPLSCSVGGYITEHAPSDLLDTFGRQRADVFYLAGKVLNWISSDAVNAFLIGYYKHPGISQSSYDSWIAENHPFVLVNLASASLFKSIGQQDEASAKQQLAIAQLQQVAINEIEATAR